MFDARIIWDLPDDLAGNVEHIAEHGITPEEVEEVLFDRNSQRTTSRSSGENITFGETSSGRYIAVVWEHICDNPRTLRPITAFDAQRPPVISEKRKIMGKKPLKRTNARTPDQIDRDQRIRSKYQATRPSLAALQESADYSASISQGDYLEMMEFAATIKARRIALSLSLADLSLRTGIDKAAISRLENGQAENPTFNTLERIARALNQRLRLVLEDEPTGTR